MKVVFADKRLALVRGERAHELGLPVAVIKMAREKLNFLAEAPDERTLRNWKALQFKRRKGSENHWQIRVNDQYRILFTINNGEMPPVITIIDICDPH